ncbi:hypothetical protein DFR28_1021163 [Arenicella xantha]|uniref:Uncharacterized protein n=1 Tax=Arenicella xantha TaxID=644221 RepID=A0A395JSP6_9GAMM|nr:hypothetical protein DFR28_1021163 [Arenicella xantha]
MSSSRVEVARSTDSQDGDNLLIIDSTELDFENDSSSFYDLFRHEAYLIQTIVPNKLQGKHLHISGFAKSTTPDFLKLEELFDEKVAESDREKFEMRMVNFNEDMANKYRAWYEENLLLSSKLQRELFAEEMRRSNAIADFGIWVFLHMEEGQYEKRRIYKHIPTSAGHANQNDLWNRFNVEVSVPENCEAVSIVLWSKGLNIVEFDHIAVVEQGQSLAKSTANSYLSSYDELYDYFAQAPSIVVSEFTNLSFEN